MNRPLPIRRAAPALLLLLAACGGERPAERPEADAGRLWAYLTDQTALGPRVAGLPGHARTAQYLRRHLESRAGAGNVTERRTPYTTSWNKPAELVSLLARFNPGATTRVLVVAPWNTPQHVDSAGVRTAFVPGANDNASGVAVLMELAELFRQQAPPVGVDLLLVDGTSRPGMGPGGPLLGNREFLALLPQGYRARHAVVVRMVGDKELRIAKEPSSQRAAPETVRRIWEVAADMGQDTLFRDSAGAAVDDAQTALGQAGIPAVEVGDFSYGYENVFWRTPQDLPSRVDRESMRAVAEVLAEVIYREGRAP